MADEKVKVPGTTDATRATTAIGYCPHLGMYHYKREDGEEFFFNREQLEISLADYLQQHDLKQANFMAKLTGYARKYPHVMVVIKADGTYNLVRLEIPEDERETKIVEDELPSH